jgi:hypothetical protein
MVLVSQPTFFSFFRTRGKQSFPAPKKPEASQGRKRKTMTKNRKKDNALGGFGEHTITRFGCELTETVHVDEKEKEKLTFCYS